MRRQTDTTGPSGPAAPALTCPRCGTEFAPGAVLCCQCGYHLELGCSLQTDVDTALPWTDRRREDVGSDRSAYAGPIITFLVAVGLLVGITLIAYGPPAMVAALATLGLGIPVALAAYLACAALWIGHDAPVHLTILRLAAALAVTQLAGSMAPWWFVSWPLSFLVCVGMLAELLELDLTDATAVAVLTIVLKIVVAFALAAALAG